VKDVFPKASLRRICSLLGVSRSALAVKPAAEKKPPVMDELLVERTRRVITEYPTFGYRHVWAILRFGEGVHVNRKAIYRIFRIKGWFVHQRAVKPKPRVRGSRSRASRSNERWAMDLTHVHCGVDGWAHLAAVIDCHDREIVGFEFARRGRAKEAERAVEGACIQRFGTLRPAGETPLLRSDNGLIFQARRFRAACRDYRLQQEFITPYTPEQNGMIERFFRTLKEECVWQKNFASFAEARREVSRWIRWYNAERPHSALGYKSPLEYRAQQVASVA